MASPTFQDILLELQVSNETLDKIQRSSDEIRKSELLKDTVAFDTGAVMECLACIEDRLRDIVDNAVLLVENTSHEALYAEDTRNLLQEQMRLIKSGKLQGMAYDKQVLDDLGQIVDNTEPKKGADHAQQLNFKMPEGGIGKMGGILVGLLSLGAMILGFITGVVTEAGRIIGEVFPKIKLFFKEKWGAISEWFEGLGDMFEDFMADVEVEWRIFTQRMSKLFRPFREWGESIAKYWEETIVDFKKIWTGFKQIFTTIKNGGEAATEEAGAMSKFFTWVGDFFKMIGKFAEGFFKFGKLIGEAVTKLLGKLAIPVLIIMSLIDGIKGFIEGYKADGILLGFQKAFSGIVDGLFGFLFDWPVKFVQWIYKKLGWDEAAKSLEGVNFKSLLDGFFNWLGELEYAVVNGLDAALTEIEDWFKGGGAFTKDLKRFGEAILSLFKMLPKLLISILPKSIQALIPDSVKKMAGFEGNAGSDEQAKNSVAGRGKTRDQNVLMQGAQMLANPALSEKTRAGVIGRLEKDYGFSPAEIEAAVKDRVTAASTTQVNQGAEMNGIAAQTNDLNATPTIVGGAPAASGGGGGNKTITNTSSSVTVIGADHADRTNAALMSMMGAYQ